MSDEQTARQIQDILRRLDLQEAKSQINYAKAAYTPTYLGGTTAGVTTYSIQQGWYWRLGRVLFVTGAVVWTAATGTGNAQISLPFVPSATAGFRASGGVRTNAITFANSAPQLQLSATAAFFTLESPLTNAAPTTVAIEAAGNLLFSLFYGVD